VSDDGGFEESSNGNDAQTLTPATIDASIEQERHMSSFLLSRAGLVLIDFMIIAGALLLQPHAR
jgi:hypothetical protein